MGKAPAFQFYPGDWFREPGLKCVDLNVRGAWAELLMIMWDCNPQGEKQTTLEGFSRLWRTTLEESAFIIDQLDQEHIAEVEYFDEDCKKIIHQFSDFHKALSPDCPDLSPECPVYVTIRNRRMFRAWNDKEYERLKKQRQRKEPKHPPECPQNVPVHSSSSSSSSNKNTLALFEIFYKAYPKKKSRGDAEKAWKKINPDQELLNKMLSTIAIFKDSEDWKKDRGQFIPYPASWLNAKGWEDEPLKVKDSW